MSHLDFLYITDKLLSVATLAFADHPTALQEELYKAVCRDRGKNSEFCPEINFEFIRPFISKLDVFPKRRDMFAAGMLQILLDWREVGGF